jgi:hypothetical protein
MMNHFVCSECGTKYQSPESTPPPGIKWSDGHVCTPKAVVLPSPFNKGGEGWNKLLDDAIKKI